MNSHTILIFLNALPTVSFIVDQNLRIIEFNSLALTFLGDSPNSVLKLRTGEVLHCLNAEMKGCGKSLSCQHCIINQSVKLALTENTCVRQRLKMNLSEGKQVKEKHFLISASPLLLDGQQLILLTVEDINVLLEIVGVVPICSRCKKVRSKEDNWVQLEAYFKNQWDLNFSHGLCPGCFEQEISNLPG